MPHSCIRIIPYSAVQFAVFEQAKYLMIQHCDWLRSTSKSGDVELNTNGRLLAGAIAGIASVFSTYPLDIARTRLSLLQFSTDNTSAKQTPQSIQSVVKYIYREEGGIRALYRGISPTTLVSI